LRALANGAIPPHWLKQLEQEFTAKPKRGRPQSRKIQERNEAIAREMFDACVSGEPVTKRAEQIAERIGDTWDAAHVLRVWRKYWPALLQEKILKRLAAGDAKRRKDRIAQAREQSAPVKRPRRRA
jgi:hypothetical protein